jgi:hypothetical protein
LQFENGKAFHEYTWTGVENVVSIKFYVKSSHKNVLME